MAGGIGNTKKQAALDTLLGSSAPATVYVALLTDSNTDIQRMNGTLTEVTTTNWTNYARVAVTNNAANWAAAAINTGTAVASKTNANAVSFTANATVTGTGPTPTAFVIFDHITNSAVANIIAVGPLTSGNTVVVNGNNVNFAAGALSVTLV